MLNKKRLMASLMASAMIVSSAVACGSSDDKTTTAAPVSTTVAATEAPTQAPTQAPTEAPTEAPTQAPVTYEEGKVVTFEDGKYAFIGYDEAKVDFDACDATIVDYKGSKALKFTSKENVSGKSFYVGIDVASLLGENITKVAQIKMDIAVEAVDGKFHACSFTVAPTHKAAATNVSIYADRVNPKTVVIDVPEGTYNDGEKACIVIKKLSDTAGNNKDTAYLDTNAYSSMILDNIQFLDKDGNLIEVNTDASFVAPSGFGAVDFSNATKRPYGEIDLGIGGMTGNSWWPVASNSFQTYVPGEGEDPAAYTIVDASLFKPGMVMTVYFDCAATEWQVPYLRAQVTADYKNVDINATFTVDADGNRVKNEAGEYEGAETYVNKSFSIMQFTYEQLLAAFTAAGFDETVFSDIRMLGVCDQSVAYNVLKVTIGATVDGEAINNVSNGNSGSTDGGWGQAVKLNPIKNGGDFDVEKLIVPGSAFVVNFSADNGGATPLEVILQSWTEGAPDGSGWCKINPTYWNETEAVWTYETLKAAFGSEDFASYVDALYVGDLGCALAVSGYYFVVPTAE